MSLLKKWNSYRRDYSYDWMYEKLDGGWGWIIVAATFISLFFFAYQLTCFGLMYDSKLSSMGYETTGSSVIFSSMFLFYNILGPLYGHIVKVTTYQFSAAIGGLAFVLGHILSAFVNQFWHLIISYSLFVGVGFGLSSTSGIVAISNFFQKWKSTAVGLAYGGFALSQLVFPPLIALMHSMYGHWGTQILLGVAALNIVASALLLHPLRWHSQKKEGDSSELTRTPAVGEEENPDKISQDPGNEVKDSCSVCSIWTSMFDSEILRSTDMIFYFIVCTSNGAADNFLFMYLTTYLDKKLGLSQDEVAQCLVWRGSADIVLRFVFPFIIDKLKIKAKDVLTYCILAVACFRLGMTFTTSFTAINIILAFEGFLREQVYVFHIVTISDLCPEKKVPTAFGLNLLFQGIGSFILGPILGYIRDSTKNYDLVIYIMTTIQLLAVSIWIVEKISYVIRSYKYDTSIHRQPEECD